MGSRSLLVFALLGVFACSSSEDGDDATTNDDNEVNEGIGVLERQMSPPVAVPDDKLLGGKVADVLADAKRELTAQRAKRASDGCSTTPYTGTSGAVLLEHVVCEASEVVRVLDEGGYTKTEHGDLNKDGVVDRFSSEFGRVAQTTDTDFDGKVDVIVERVASLQDFSLAGYESANYPKSAFLFRVREDRDHDGKLDFEKLTAKGALAR